MPCFYFHVYTDDDVPDTEGKMLANLEAAREHARALARQTIAGLSEAGRATSLDHHIDVEDERGVVIAKIGYSEELAEG
jgi:hypothetical protein